MSLKGKVAIVTGGNSGIGLSTVLARLRRFAGFNTCKCHKIRDRAKKVCTTTDSIGQFAGSGNSWFRLGGKLEI
jgi:NAD(P)-dependent dehydrogenase (short-subunit alcohol dehydrogenase family)